MLSHSAFPCFDSRGGKRGRKTKTRATVALTFLRRPLFFLPHFSLRYARCWHSSVELEQKRLRLLLGGVLFVGTVFLLSSYSLPSPRRWTLSSSDWTALTTLEHPSDALLTTFEAAPVALPTLTPLAPPALPTPPPPSAPTQSHVAEAPPSHHSPTPSSTWTRPATNLLNLTSNAWPPPETPSRDARYLSYLTHSGFHNQRSVSSSS